MATLNGGPGNDTLLGGFEGDTINGLGGNDTLRGEDANDTLNGGAGNDKLVGGVENDVLAGEAGNDTLDGGLDDDTLKGGAGNDLYLVDTVNDVVEEVPGGGNDTIRATVTYHLSDGQEIEGLTLDSSGEITGMGNSNGNLITMVGAGEATMWGRAGNDTLKGGIGNDALRGDQGDDIMAGGKGDDSYQIDSLADKISELAGQGTDFVISGLDHYTLGANLEDLTVNGHSGTGNTLNNRIFANNAVNILSGVGGNDTIWAGFGNDTLLGGAGNDTLRGEFGDDSMNGGAGNDYYVVSEAGDIVTEAKGGGTDTIETALDNLTLAANVENLLLAGVASLNAAGNALANKMTGTTGQNMLLGEAGNDTLDGGGGNDTLKGGSGNDLYVVDSVDDVVEDGVGGGKDTIRATSSYQLNDGQEIESLILDSTLPPDTVGYFVGKGNGHGNLITMVGTGQAEMYGYGLAGDDTLKGGIGSDILLGGKDDDVLSGGDGSDLLVGEDGADTMTGGDGRDVYEVDNVADKIIELAGQGIDTVATSLVSYTLAANVEHLRLEGAALNGTGNALNNSIYANGWANKLNGGAGNDYLSGSGGNDTLYGGAGADTLNGGAGADSMIGGAGSDVYVCDDAGDVIVELAGGGIDTVHAFHDGHVLAANIENLTFFAGGITSGTGNGLDNVLVGNGIGNVLTGEAGNDTLDGAGGDDTLKGGSGNDLYLVDRFNDVVEEGVGGGKDTIRATFTYQLNDSQEIESFILDSNTVIGGFGNSQGNLITMVGTGPAVMYGNGGNDTLTGGAGDDVLQGDAGKDILTGGGGLDVMAGGEDSDTLKGGAGDDLLTGGLGADALFGEAGADWFSYAIDLPSQLANLGNDKISGFQKGVDKIDLRDLIIDFGIDADDAFTGGFVILSKAGANTIVQFDQDGSAGGLGPVTLATVTGATVTAADVVLEY